MKFSFVAAKEVAFPVETMCHVLGVSRSGYYAWKKEAPARQGGTGRPAHRRDHHRAQAEWTAIRKSACASRPARARAAGGPQARREADAHPRNRGPAKASIP